MTCSTPNFIQNTIWSLLKLVPIELLFIIIHRCAKIGINFGFILLLKFYHKVLEYKADLNGTLGIKLVYIAMCSLGMNLTYS